MGTVCASAEPQDPTDVEGDGRTPWIGIDAEPLWKQVADAQIARKKTIQAAWPEVEQQLTARAIARADEKAKEAVQQGEKLEPKTPKTPMSPKAEKTPRADPRTPKADKADKAETSKAEGAPKVVKLTKAQAQQALKKAVAIFEKPENKKRLRAAVKSAGKDSAQRIASLLPVVKELLGDLLESYDFPRTKFLQAVAQIAGHAEGDAKMTAQLSKLQAALEGQL
mmetsp:Transcript_1190/g.1286  ORF Transcript_1190/g.1286 Transcript_1190/m.1286 type:complete len:224 (+) Transcript_1190:42-713(+)